MRERIKYKGHHHVQKPRAFCKARAVSELAFTPLQRTLTESGHELILGHSPQTLIGRMVGKLYPRNPKHIHNKLWCDRNRKTSDTSNEMRYRAVNLVHVGVKLLNQHERTSDGLVTKRLPFPTVSDSGKVDVSKMTQDDSAFQMNASSGKVFRKCIVGILITKMERERCMIRKGRGTGMKRIPGRSGFIFRCHDTTTVTNRKGREKKTIRKIPKQFTIIRICEKMYKCMENA